MRNDVWYFDSRIRILGQGVNASKHARAHEVKAELACFNQESLSSTVNTQENTKWERSWHVSTKKACLLVLSRDDVLNKGKKMFHQTCRTSTCSPYLLLQFGHAWTSVRKLIYAVVSMHMGCTPGPTFNASSRSLSSLNVRTLGYFWRRSTRLRLG